MGAFNPFDERCRDKVKRRKSSEVKAHKEKWEMRVLEKFKCVMEKLGHPRVIHSCTINDMVAFASSDEISLGYIRMNMKKYMEKLGYKLIKNPNSKDGRWTKNGMNTFVYVRLEDSES